MDQNAKPQSLPTDTGMPAPAPAPKSEDAKARKAVYEAKLKQAKKEAKVRVLQFVKDNLKDLGPIADDIKVLIGARGPNAHSAVPGVTRTVNADLRTAFLDKKALSEMDIFKQFHLGRPEMVNKRRVLVLCPNPADRVWVDFDEKTETYIVVGTGPTPPTGFTGYIPQAKVL